MSVKFQFWLMAFPNPRFVFLHNTRRAVEAVKRASDGDMSVDASLDVAIERALRLLASSVADGFGVSWDEGLAAWREVR